MIRVGAVTLLLLFASQASAHAEEPGKAGSDCPPPARYVMPKGVEVPSPLDEDQGVAPADLPGSRTGFAVPPQIKFDLGFNPTGTAFDESWLPLGEVSIDRKTGTASIDGQPLEDVDPCVTAPAKPEPSAKSQSVSPPYRKSIGAEPAGPSH